MSTPITIRTPLVQPNADSLIVLTLLSYKVIGSFFQRPVTLTKKTASATPNNAPNATWGRVPAAQ